MKKVIKYCTGESENNFGNWFRKQRFPNLLLKDYRDPKSDETISLLKKVGESKPPPDYGLAIESNERIVCFIDVKCPDLKVGDSYNLPDHKFEKYCNYSRFFNCPCYLVFYDQVRTRGEDGNIEVHSTEKIVGWAKLHRIGGYIQKVEKSPFECEVIRFARQTPPPNKRVSGYG